MGHVALTVEVETADTGDVPVQLAGVVESLAANGSVNVIVVLLKQSCDVSDGTSDSSAKIISAHYISGQDPSGLIWRADLHCT